MKKYNQVTAMLAITRASLRAIFRSPSAVIFSFVFPFIFILVFGFIGDNGAAPTYKVVIDKNSDTTNALFDSIRTNKMIRIVSFKDTATLRSNKIKGRIAGILKIMKTGIDTPAYTYQLLTTNASEDQWPQLMSILNTISNKVNDAKFPSRPRFVVHDPQPIVFETVREYHTIDFILPGQLGFSLLSSGVFGVAFMFFNLRSTLVLKRFFATPISRTHIILGEGLARVIFQMLTAIVIITAGRFLFGFTLVNGIETFAEMLILSFMGLIVFMGFGFIVSGLAKSDSTIPPLANLITLPQFLLAGTFFSIDAFPQWLQIIAKLLPLTYLNIAMRAVAFEGAHFWSVTANIGTASSPFFVPVIAILFLWGIVVYAGAVKLFKWE